MALPESIPTSYLRNVRVQRADGSFVTLYDVAERVYDGTFRLQERGAAATAAATDPSVTQAQNANGTRTVTVTFTA